MVPMDLRLDGGNGNARVPGRHLLRDELLVSNVLLGERPDKKATYPSQAW